MELEISEQKNIILSCIREFNSLYGKGGIAKILKGSKSLKENEFNNKSLNSRYFGLFHYSTIEKITNIIEELLEEKKLTIVKKGSFARPMLALNPEVNFDYLDNVEIKIAESNNDDDNISAILKLIKKKENIFITGHAGTGKSYILNKLKEKLPKLVITSTTGIAAVNVKGQTIHSWAGVGICNRPIEYTVERILKRSATKKQIQKCKLLAIDEISMLDIKTFEYVDKVLRQVRENDEPFGGIQLIVIGDFFQLPPVNLNTDDERKYCFESELWNDLNFKTIMLTKNYRQNEEKLITALSNMRINSLSDDDIKLFKTRECTHADDLSDILHIFATNAEADNYNNYKFRNITEPEYTLRASDGIYKGKELIETAQNERDENIFKRIDMVCNAEKNIALKLGVRVMLLTNLSFEDGLINGSCGVVEEINDDYVLVKFDNGVTSQITKHDFEFYNNEVLIAVRKQFPLRLAYGITIHKSQGMSLDKLVVDCSRIFEKGQAYVALSRIKTLEGLYLFNFNPQKVMVDEKVVDFYQTLDIVEVAPSIVKKEIVTEPVIEKEEKAEPLVIENPEYAMYANKIKDIILNENRWIEVFEIAKILGIKRHDRLVNNENNSTIGHIINRFLKKQGFVTHRINYETGYSILVAPPNFSIDDIPSKLYEEKSEFYFG